MAGLKLESKYKNKRVEIDGHVFPSRKEAYHYRKLKLLMEAGIVKDIILQPPFELQPKFKTPQGETIRAIKYVADFKVFYADGRIEVVDVKGYKTAEYKLKKKMFLYKFPGITFVEV